MKLNVLTVIIANPKYPLTYANYPSRAYTVYEHEKLYGYGSISTSKVSVEPYHIIPSIDPVIMHQESNKLYQHLQQHSYDTVHFYFESPIYIQKNITFWTNLLCTASSIRVGNLPSYLFTHSNANVLLNDVLQGILNGTPSNGYSDFLDSVYISKS